MKAVIQTTYGSPNDLDVGEVERPSPGEGEVLVRVRAASVHPDVWHVVRGLPLVLRLMGNGIVRPKFRVPGTDMAGVVEWVGSGVTEFREGDAVFGETRAQMQWKNGGAYAEYAVVPVACLALKPDNVSFAQAASIPASGYIALINLRGGRVIRPGMNVLVNGAGGGVGSLALQLAKAWGAHVTAVDGTNKLDMLLSLGADEAIDYSREDFTRSEARYDFIFDVPGNHSISECLRVLKPAGRYVLIGHQHYDASGQRVFGLIPLFIGMIARSFFVKQLRLGRDTPTRREVMSILRDFLADGRITPIIDSTYALQEVREAFRHMIEDEPRGKVILTLPA